MSKCLIGVECKEFLDVNINQLVDQFAHKNRIIHLELQARAGDAEGRGGGLQVVLQAGGQSGGTHFVNEENQER